LKSKEYYFGPYHVNICVSCSFVCINRTIAESKKKYEEKHMKAQQLREKLREEKTLKLQKLLERVSFSFHKIVGVLYFGGLIFK
jgi:sorbitol-specific phosphotransferase system component IIBC